MSAIFTKFDISRFDPKLGDKFSPNLYAYLNGLAPGWGDPHVYRDSDGVHIIGVPNDGDIIGIGLWRVLTHGKKALKHRVCYGGGESTMEHLDTFWADYAAAGRCVVDAKHSCSFIGDELRFTTADNYRKCNWCGHSQWLHCWQETVDREEWRNLP